MGLFCHFQIDTKRLKRKLALFSRAKQGLSDPPPPELGMSFEISRGFEI
jgi:hypothetical protein